VQDARQWKRRERDCRGARRWLTDGRAGLAGMRCANDEICRLVPLRRRPL
jgi:hypothetical protein